MTERTVKLTDRQARVVAHALAYNRLAEDGWPGRYEYPHIDDDSWSLVTEYIEFLGERVLEAAFEMVDDIDDVDELLQRAQYGGDE